MTTTATRTDGGPAFPVTGPNGDHPGMSLRDYFAAHAPSDIPSWFRSQRVISEPQPERPGSMDAGLHAQNPRIRAAIREWWQAYNRVDADVPAYNLDGVGETDDEKKFLATWEREFTEFAEACENRRIRHEATTYIAWRWFYADAMLAAKERA